MRTGTTLRSRLLPLLVGAATLVAAAAPAQTIDKSPTAKAEVLAKVSSVIANYAFVPNVDFTQWPKFLASQQQKIDAAKTDDEFMYAVNGALREFGFSHIVLLSPKIVTGRKTNKTVGIGITSQIVDDGIYILRVVPKAPAAEAGLVPGDTIIEVNGKKPEGITGIPGDAGTQLVVKVRHTNKKTQNYRLTRREFSTIRPEELTWPTADTAVLTIYTFDFTYDAERVEKLIGEARTAKTLILDLRNNGGGAVVNLQHLAGLLMPGDKSLGYYVDKASVKRYTKDTQEEPKDLTKVALTSGRKLMPFKNDVEPFTGKLIVLTNGGSGSASEILAAALQENGTPIIGTKSAGAVLVSTLTTATNGFQLQYPFMDFVTPKGRRLEGQGVIPDVDVPEPRIQRPDERDKALDGALALAAKSNGR